MFKQVLASLDQTLRERVLTGAVLGPAIAGVVLLDGLTPLLGLPLLVLWLPHLRGSGREDRVLEAAGTPTP